MSQLRTNSIVPVGGIPAGASGGGIIQVVSSPYYTQTELAPGASFTQIGSWSASITPRSANSKILVDVDLNASGSYSYYVVAVRLYVNGVYQAVASDNGSRPGTFMTIGAQQWSNYYRYQAHAQYLHSPGTTNQQTYSLWVRDTRDSQNVYINRAYYDENSGAVPVGNSCITLMEISG